MVTPSRPGHPLTGVRVIDLSQLTAGPMATKMLVDAGADVTKVEPVTGDASRRLPPFVTSTDGTRRVGSYFLRLAAGKRSVAIDLKTPRGRAALLALLPRADVLVEAFRPGVMARLGLDYPTLHPRFPRLVYVSISGYGQPTVRPGPLADRPSYDPLMQAATGISHVTGPADGPPTLVGASIGDTVPGMVAAYGTVLALYQRALTGEGTHVDVAQFDTLLLANDRNITSYLHTGVDPVRGAAASSVPYDIYRCADGHVVIAVGSDAQWASLCRILGRAEWAADPRTGTAQARRAHYHELILPVLEPWVRARPGESIVGQLNAAGIPAGMVDGPAEIARSAQVKARQMIRRHDHPAFGEVYSIGAVPALASGPPATPAPPAELGQHTREVLAEVGYDRDTLAGLEQDGVIRSWHAPSRAPSGRTR